MEELYDFPKLEDLDVTNTEVTGDIRTMGINDFKALKRSRLERVSMEEEDSKACMKLQVIEGN